MIFYFVDFQLNLDFSFFFFSINGICFMGLNACVILIGSIIYCFVWLLRNCGKVEKETVVLLLNIYILSKFWKKRIF